MLKASLMALALVPALANDMDDQEMADFLGVRLLTSNNTNNNPTTTEVNARVDIVVKSTIKDICAIGAEGTPGCRQAVAILANQTIASSAAGFSSDVVDAMGCTATGLTCTATVSLVSYGCEAGKDSLDTTCLNMYGAAWSAGRRLAERELTASSGNTMFGDYDVQVTASAATASFAQDKIDQVTTKNNEFQNKMKESIQSSQNQTQYDITDEQLSTAFNVIQERISDAGAVLRYNTSADFTANVKELAKQASNAASSDASGECLNGCTTATTTAAPVGGAVSTSMAASLAILFISALLK